MEKGTGHDRHKVSRNPGFVESIPDENGEQRHGRNQDRMLHSRRDKSLSQLVWNFLHVCKERGFRGSIQGNHQLAAENDQAKTCHQAVDDARAKGAEKDSKAKKSGEGLQQASHHDGSTEDGDSVLGNEFSNDRNETIRWSRNLQWRAASQSHDDSANDPGDNAFIGSQSARSRDSDTQGQRD